MKQKQSQNWAVVGLVALLAAVVLLRTVPSEGAQNIIWLSIGAAMIFAVCFCTARILVARLRDNAPDSGCLVSARALPPLFFYLSASLLGVGLVIVIFYYTHDYSEANKDLLTGLGLACFIVGTIAVFLGAFQLKITGHTIEYWSLERGYQSLSHDDIERARIRIGRSSKPGIRLEILPRGAGKKPIFVALKAFKVADMDRVFDWLGPKLEDPGKLTVVKQNE
jgi:hypothetical protein